MEKNNKIEAAKKAKKVIKERQKKVQEFKSAYTKEEMLRELARFELKGNIIDQGWFTHLKNDRGMVQTNAIIILSEIVYWYRPTLVFDGETNNITGLKAKFKGDMLQKSYNQLSEKFGLTQRQTTDACKFLEKEGIIILDFRTITLSNNRQLNNVLYIGLNINKLKAISVLMNDSLKFIEDIEDIQGDTQEDIEEDIEEKIENNEKDNTENNTKNIEDNKKTKTSELVKNTEPQDPITKKRDSLSRKNVTSYHENCRHPVTKKRDTYTKTTSTKTTCTDISQSISLDKNEKTDRLTDRKANEDLQNIFEEFKSRFGIDYLKEKYIAKEELIDEIFLNILDMYTNDNTIIQKQSKPQSIIRGVLSKLTDTHIEGLVLKFEEVSKTTTIKNIKAYIQTMIYNAALETELSIKNYINSDFKRSMRDMYEEQKSKLSILKSY